MDIRNIAIIAHVDHGKTTLTDALLRQTGMIEATGSMDSNSLELERGITIYAKNTTLYYKDVKINIVDTPGHADFGSEVERVLRSIDSVILVVDAQEGPMPQTKFVLKKSLELGLRPLVVLNKIDKPAARPDEVHEEVLELFMDLGANDEQMNFPYCYAIGKQGIAKKTLDDTSTDMTPLLDLILEHVSPAPHDTSAPFRMQPFNLAYDDFVGRLAIGRIYEGKLHVSDKVIIKKSSGETRSGTITKLQQFKGFDRIETTEAFAGDIVMISGIPDIDIGETICHSADQEPLPAIQVDEPTIGVDFLVNNSPFAGKEGKFVTTRQIKERLQKELEINVGLKIDFSDSDKFKVYGRGELHIAILLEQMRREGFEIQVSQPKVIIKEIEGKKSEPFEEVTIDVPEQFTGTVIEKLSKRKGVMTNMVSKNGHARITFDIPSRGLLGYRGPFIMDTKGEGLMASQGAGFKPYVGEIEKRNVGSMISMVAGKALGYSLANLQDRGTLYIGPTVEVYEGMVIGNTAKGEDMAVNPIKGKQLTNMRASGTDDALNLTPHMDVTLERGLEIMSEDEYLEITPKNIRIRKQFLTENDRKRSGRKA
ncbi:MAG: translational GTPase TypA [Candidatus Magasanikbacteria bacterium CG_4_9_14_0_2_um_filter_41_10]|uniref:50S ribosomal subunit assembly factor BipA n=1 Tax=Candidatus Magasanikbacteria bacterium CG_4_10_14_0_2_um_filter_41_31 TaxID=1974639 RepID=A0A2M7V5J9_9BACT|nr:MAG: GTP-binding protein TypA [Candidatus Magasanikbacteria bacterium CG1_02_41_34]PIZ93873.1 MAG: translational GTPase TypA [Candidatus Magasanikbacteria bacterium CG_4_10_14_0_2_um_filter_41_31]PJC53289.1 MAG: translational GTPase TypA [Candidatus Magasanikbacteria bacterium CG_4_9_14_0_2_um_filter_41_10]